jgi:parallel beta-helix repeat protein
MLALIVIASFLGAASIPLTYASDCPTANSTVSANLTLTGPCSYSGTNGFYLASGVTLDCAHNSLIQTSTTVDYYAVMIEHVYGVTVKNCVFSGAWYEPLFAEWASGLTISNNVFTAGTSGTPEYPVVFEEYVTTSTVSGNMVTSCTYDGFWIYDSYNIALSSNTAHNCVGYGYYVYESTGSLTGNAATYNDYGFYFYYTALTLTNNKADHNTVYGYYDYSYASASGPGTLGTGNTYINNECHSDGTYGSYDEAATFGPAGLCTPQG